jgi:hypothetical protein
MSLQQIEQRLHKASEEVGGEGEEESEPTTQSEAKKKRMTR